MVYRNVKAELARYGLRLEDLAKRLNLSVSATSNKINGKTDWTLSEAMETLRWINGFGAEQHTVASLFEEGRPVVKV